MKRILFVLALMLILTVCFVGEAFALNRPWTEADNGGGEDHPWGGDESSDPTPILVKTGSDVTFATSTTSYTAFDFIFRYFILDRIISMEEVYTKKQTPQAHRIESYDYATEKSKGIRK